MSRLTLAFRIFFATLFGSVPVEEGQALLGGPPEKTSGKADPKPRKTAESRVSKPPKRSEAITLLAMLQREARLVDLMQEPLAEYSDEQIGAAARSVLSESAAVLKRVLQLQPIVEVAEDSQVETPDGFSVARYHITGDVSGDGPFRGRLVHHGWIATRCELPQWSGNENDSKVIAPVELEV